MSEETTDPLFVSLTRREEWAWGYLPFVPSILVLTAGLMTFVVFKDFTFFFLSTVVPLVALSLMHMHDQDASHIIWRRFVLWTRSGIRNRFHWGATSYSP